MSNEPLELLPEVIPVKEYDGVIAYKGVKTGRYYFIKNERYMGIPLMDRSNAITLMKRADIAFRNGDNIPEYLTEYLTVGYD